MLPFLPRHGDGLFVCLSIYLRDRFRFIDGSQQSLRLIETFLVFIAWNRIGDDARARLNISASIFDDHRTQCDGCALIAVMAEVAHRACVDAALLSFELADDLHRTYLGRARNSARRETGA